VMVKMTAVITLMKLVVPVSTSWFNIMKPSWCTFRSIYQ
jgi:hypothetical protein